jgi:hypothetical protein
MLGCWLLVSYLKIDLIRWPKGSFVFVLLSETSTILSSFFAFHSGQFSKVKRAFPIGGVVLSL